MRRGFSLSVLMAAMLLLSASASADQSGSQRPESGVAGRERSARPPELRAPAPDDSKPPAKDRNLREIEKIESQCLAEVNRQRKAQGIAPLEFSEALLPIARAHSRRMAEEGFFDHADPDGRTVRQRVDEAGIKWRTLGENLAFSNGYINPVAVSLSGWMDSASHRRNILDSNYTRSAVGVWISEDGTVYFTEIFLRE